MSVNDNLFIFFILAHSSHHQSSGAQPPHRMHPCTDIIYSISTCSEYGLPLCGVIDWYDLIVNAAERLLFFLLALFVLPSQPDSIYGTLYAPIHVRWLSQLLRLRQFFCVFIFLVSSSAWCHCTHSGSGSAALLLSIKLAIFFFFLNSIATWESTKSNTLAN